MSHSQFFNAFDSRVALTSLQTYTKQWLLCRFEKELEQQLWG